MLAGVLWLVLSTVETPTAGAIRHGEVTVTAWIHASVQLEHAGTVIQIDPWSKGRLDRAKPADLVLITDADGGGHHLDPAAVRLVRKPGAPVVMPAIGREKLPDGIVLANGERGVFAGIAVEAIGAYDLTPGEPYHPKGEANGYLLTLGRSRVYVAGVTECVPEMLALGQVDVAFMPMNLPLGRMKPPAVARCAAQFKPKVIYPYHYDQDYVRRLSGRDTPPPSGLDIGQTLRELTSALRGTGVEVRTAEWYP